MEKYETMVIRLRDDLVIELQLVINEEPAPDQDPYAIIYFKINGENLW